MAFVAAASFAEGPRLIRDDVSVRYDHSRQGVVGFRIDLGDYASRLDRNGAKIAVYRVPASEAQPFTGSEAIGPQTVKRYLKQIIQRATPPAYIGVRAGEIVYIGVLEDGLLKSNVPAPAPFVPSAGNEPILQIATGTIAGTYSLSQAFSTTVADSTTYDYFMIAQPYAKYCLDTSKVVTTGVQDNGLGAGIVKLSAVSGGGTTTLSGTLVFTAANSMAPYVVYVARQKKSTPSKVYERFGGAEGNCFRIVTP